MRSVIDPPLVPKQGNVLKVLGITRVSKAKDGATSNADQHALLERWLNDHAGMPFELTTIAGEGSGEVLDRTELLQAAEMVESGVYDVVLHEDLGRVSRRMYAFTFCELCEDHDARLIAINDHVDTGSPDWRLNAFFAVMRHETYNRDTAARIRRSLRNRFLQGGVIQYVVYGYIKPAGAKSDAELQKDPAAEPIYAEWFRRLANGATYAEIADWLNELAIPVGPFCRQTEWTRRMVRRLTHNPILKGVRERNRKVARRINKTGRRRSVDAAPEELLERHCPHLAFIETELYDLVIQQLRRRNEKNTRVKDGLDPLKNRPRKRTVWPGQHLICGICGRKLYYGGHGQSHRLLCSGANDYRCWNAISVDGPHAARKLSETILNEIRRLPDFDASLVREIETEMQAQHEGRRERLESLKYDAIKVERELSNLCAAIREAGSSTTLIAELRELENRRESIQAEQRSLEKPIKPQLSLPPIEEIRSLALDAVGKLAIESQEFSRLMRLLIERIVIIPVRLIDGGHIGSRAQFELNLTPLVPGLAECPKMDLSLSKHVEVDLFDPPQRETFREEVVELTATGMPQRQIAATVGITLPAVQYAMRLQRLMDTQGCISPYIPVLKPPSDYNKLRRHLHPRFRFVPLFQPAEKLAD